MKINPINSKIIKKGTISTNKKNNFVNFSSADFNKDVLVRKKIIKEDENINSFFEKITNEIFNFRNEDFLSAIKNGEISLSTCAYSNIKQPYSAVGITLDGNSSDAANMIKIEENIKNNLGMGINFSDFDNPNDKILKINSYMKYREKENNSRPPAAIGLLDIEHPKIIDFIKLKDNADYSEWCFDLSVIINDNFMKKLENNDEKANKIYQTLINSMKKSGEPGIIFSNDKNYICDCCAAVPLKENEKLSIGHINLSKSAFDNKVDYQKIKKDAKILSSAMQKLDKNSYIGVLGYQDLLNKINVKYGSNEAIKIAEESMKIIQNEAKLLGLKTAISPTGNISRFLNTSPSIEPDKSDYKAEILTMKAFQKHLDGNISKTILLNGNHTTNDIDNIIKTAYKEKLKGISVYTK